MPARIVRAEINQSVSLSQVSLEADLTFRALLVAVDDFGRMDARPAILKAALFPTREDVTADTVMRWVHELASIERPPVILYEVEGRRYLQLTGWEKHRGKGRRAEESRHPSPDEADVPRISLKSEDLHFNPPVGRGTLDVGRGTRDEKRETRGSAEPLSLCRGGQSTDLKTPPAFDSNLRSTWEQLVAVWQELQPNSRPRFVDHADHLARAVERFSTEELLEGFRWCVKSPNAKACNFRKLAYGVQTFLKPENLPKYVEASQTSDAWEDTTRSPPDADPLEEFLSNARRANDH